MNAQTYFADTVAAGWTPRHPCTDLGELATLAAMPTRGDCISPLVMDGDIVYIDRHMKPEPGDVVNFALSQRGADVQNSGKQEGRLLEQPMWKQGDQWCKLLGTRHGLQLLYDRHGHEVTATLMCCESPDDVPILNPVRQICRNGRLLFTDTDTPQLSRRAVLLGAAVAPIALAGCGGDAIPLGMLPACEEASGSQIDAGAATATFIGYNGTPDSPGPSSWSGYIRGNTVFTVPAPAYDCTLIVTATATGYQSAGTLGTVYPAVDWLDDGATDNWSSPYSPLPSVAESQIALQAQFSHSSSNTTSVVRIGYYNSTGASATIVVGAWHVQVEFIKR